MFVFITEMFFLRLGFGRCIYNIIYELKCEYMVMVWRKSIKKKKSIEFGQYYLYQILRERKREIIPVSDSRKEVGLIGISEPLRNIIIISAVLIICFPSRVFPFLLI